ncbi:unnamed protein product [Allacma fusca]|uniref:Uncharacterized protein n=1 Tax=Allacma fusca TaxID=39272 RepID=A0A8J2PH10_9HEXA|nr:unnamed protein product [Allacma fusca]
MIIQLVLLFQFVVSGVRTFEDTVELEMFTDRDYKGEAKSYKIERCTFFPWMGTRVSSIKILKGSCLKIFSSKGCSGEHEFIKYPTLVVPLLQKGKWNDRVKSVQPCPIQQVHVKCPHLTFVRRMDFIPGDLTSGITIHCYKPGNKSPSKIINTHDVPLEDFFSSTCKAAVRGIMFTKNHTQDFLERIVPICNFTDSIDHGTLECEEDEALIGLRVQIEHPTKLIKKMELECHKVHTPALNCTPTETFQSVSVCDNSAGLEDMVCKFSQTIGIQVSQSSTKAEKKAHRFYSDFELNASGGLGSILQASFSTKIGFSQESHYNWVSTTSSIWNKVTQVEVSTSTPPGVITRLEQLVGKCSFYNVDVNYFKRIDFFSNSTSGSYDFTKFKEIDSNSSLPLPSIDLVF